MLWADETTAVPLNMWLFPASETRQLLLYYHEENDLKTKCELKWMSYVITEYLAFHSTEYISHVYLIMARWFFSTFEWHTIIVLIMNINIMRTKDRCVHYMNLFWLLFSVWILIISNIQAWNTIKPLIIIKMYSMLIWITVELGRNVLSQRWLFSLYFELQKSTRTFLATII